MFFFLQNIVHINCTTEKIVKNEHRKTPPQAQNTNKIHLKLKCLVLVKYGLIVLT